ncbi:MAG: hypothetical protein ABI397_02100 [Candidatus Saccharimonas sp.]
MTEIAPALLCESEEAYKALVERLQPFAQRVHIDLTDGEFAPTFTLSVNQLWWPENWQVDIHAMVAHPSQYVDALIQMKPSLVIFHSEVEEDLAPTIQKLKTAGIKSGVALVKSTVPSSVTNYIEAADHVLVFCGNLGKYGGTASLMQLEKVRLIRKIRSDVEIGWDGGANVNNAFSLAQGSVNVINCGSSISQAQDPAAEYKKMVDEINKHGVI